MDDICRQHSCFSSLYIDIYGISYNRVSTLTESCCNVVRSKCMLARLLDMSGVWGCCVSAIMATDMSGV